MTEKLGNVKLSVIGRFELTVKKDPKKFRLTNIDAYIPFGKTRADKVGFMTQSGEVESLMISNIKTNLYPDQNPIDQENVKRLLLHPRVAIAGYPEDQWQELVDQGIKAPKSDFLLKSLDQIEMTDFEAESSLVEARAMLYNSKNPMPVERMQWMCSNFGISYNEKTQEPKRYRAALVRRLDGWLQNLKERNLGRSNVERFVDALENIEKTEMIFYVNQLLNMAIIQKYSGIYKIGDMPVGTNIDDVINWYSNNIETFNLHKKQAIEAKKSNI